MVQIQHRSRAFHGRSFHFDTEAPDRRTVPVHPCVSRLPPVSFYRVQVENPQDFRQISENCNRSSVHTPASTPRVGPPRAIIGAKAHITAGQTPPPPMNEEEGQMSSNCMPMQSAVDISAAYFSAEIRGFQPCVFPGLVSHWAACDNVDMWTSRAKLVELLGGDSIERRVQVSPDNRIFPAVYRRSEDTIRMSSSRVADATLIDTHKPQALKIYCKCAIPTQLGCLGLPESVFGVQKTSGPKTAGETTFWMGSTGVVTPLHFDHCHTVIAQVFGRKRIIVCPPSASEHLYPHSVASGAPRTSRVDLHAWNRSDRREQALHPAVKHAMQYECNLHPGDLVYVPPSWWHHVEALDGNVSVLLPFDMTHEPPACKCSPRRHTPHR